MDNNNPSQNNLSNDIKYNFTDLPQTTVIQAAHSSSNINSNDSCSYNINGFSVMNDNDNTYPTHAHTSISLDHNHHQQHDASNNNDSQYYQQSISNGTSSNNDTISHNCQQSASNNSSPPQFYPQYIDQNPSHSTIFPLLNSLGITINSPQTNIIILPSTNSDIQNQLQHYLNPPSSTNNSQTRFQQ
ncbi:hypothetical protein C1645_802896 [Glomus cerebriforme]|uniref:Uncharacterized protein n=1 Tax=Glomus cerebriforme TaxID=658196 RepID=A0A397TF98_9GLOM|nr:hypothetical protein C1645_802896 [Glomus cerebriforme]